MDRISAGKKFITDSELWDMGYSHSGIRKLEEEGRLRRANRATYENLAYTGEENDFYSAEAYIPDGVICLMSAARYYGLTSYLPDAVEVAVLRGKKVTTLPDRPPFRLHSFSEARLGAGVTRVQEGENCFHIFDMEKTVADIIFFRNKVGTEEASEVVRNYLGRGDRQMDKLYQYGKLLRYDTALRTYLKKLM